MLNNFRIKVCGFTLGIVFIFGVKTLEATCHDYEMWPGRNNCKLMIEASQADNITLQKMAFGKLFEQSLRPDFWDHLRDVYISSQDNETIKQIAKTMVTMSHLIVDERERLLHRGYEKTGDRDRDMNCRCALIKSLGVFTSLFEASLSHPRKFPLKLPGERQDVEVEACRARMEANGPGLAGVTRLGTIESTKRLFALLNSPYLSDQEKDSIFLRCIGNFWTYKEVFFDGEKPMFHSYIEDDLSLTEEEKEIVRTNIDQYSEDQICKLSPYLQLVFRKMKGYLSISN